MKIVIDIDERAYDWLKNGYPNKKDGEYAIRIIQNGTPLPKGHGDLIDKNEITAFAELECNRHNVASLDEFTTIIQADKE